MASSAVAPGRKRFDLAIVGGTVVTRKGRWRGNVYIADGRIHSITPDRYPAAEIVNATNLFVMSGMVDAHVHLMEPNEVDREDYPSGTAAAARAGVTTVIEHTHGSPVVSLSDLTAKIERLESRSVVDYALAAHAWPGSHQDIPGMWKAGVAFFKAFTCSTHGVPGHSAAELYDLFTRTAECDGRILVHCEDASMIAAAENELRGSGRIDGAVVSTWRSREAESAAVATTVILAEQSGARVVIAHASNPDVARLVNAGRVRGANIACETCPQYLTLYEREVDEFGPLRKFTPPARARSKHDHSEMWSQVREGYIAYISSDHAPSTRKQKSQGIWDAPFGLPGLDTTLSVLLNAAHSDEISYELVTDVYSSTPARLYGLKGKGSLRPGSDADLVLVDPTATWRVQDDDILSKARWSPYSGRTLTGRAVATFVRGQSVALDGEVVAPPGIGRFVPGPGRP